VAPYVTAQLAGSLLGVLLARIAWGPPVGRPPVVYSCLRPATGWSNFELFPAETFSLALIIVLVGAFHVAIDNVLVSTLQWGLLPEADRRAVALIVLPAFIVQAISGLLALGARDSAAGTLMLSFATIWLVDAPVFYLNPPGAAAALGIFYIVFAVFISLMLASSLLKRALAAVLAVAAPRFLVAGIGLLTGSKAVSQAGAVLGFLLAGVALYTAFALLLEDSRGREVLPIGRLGAARQASHGSLAV
jgi:hypothetical protein